MDLFNNKRVRELEGLVSHLKHQLRQQRKEKKEFLEIEQNRWKNYYNGKKYSRVGVIRVSEEGKIMQQNKAFTDYFGGSFRRENLDFFEVYDPKGGDRQEVEMGEEKYIVEKIFHWERGYDLKIFEKGWFAKLKNKREESEERYKVLMESAQKSIQEAEKGISQRNLSQ